MIRIIEGNDAKEMIELFRTGRTFFDCGEGLAEAPSKADELSRSVARILGAVKARGDEGLLDIASKLGDISKDRFEKYSCIIEDNKASDTKTNPFRREDATAQSASAQLSANSRSIIELAGQRIFNFGKAVVDGISTVTIDCGEFTTGLSFRPVERVGCYVPSGRYPLPSTALMTAMTAKVAGVKEIVLISPRLEKEIIFAGTISGVSEFYEIGGAQGIAALAYGTETIRPVDMIVGPGNAYVTEAKRQVQGEVGIDMLAGPSEICVIADDGADPEWLSLDLLSQAEHDPESRAYLITTSLSIAEKVVENVARKVEELSLPEFLEESLKNSAIFVLDTLVDCCNLSDLIAPEHLLLSVSNPEILESSLTNYGALFKGYGCTVAFGDYMAGPNHTLPTNRAARFQGCLSPLTFLRPQSWINVSKQAPGLASETAAFASIEGLTAHGAAASIRAGLKVC
ncbi:MAG: histidinol dehydrogenase [Candidatus Obscuribacterales bacterium]|nr:histidinol dehydrogenase [Candidatus Obscuribacterales bacterium]